MHARARRIDRISCSQSHTEVSEEPIKKQIESEFLLLSAQILPSIINKEKERNMMGRGEGGEGVRRGARLLWRSRGTDGGLPPALSSSLRRQRKNLIMELLKISLLAELHLHV